VDKLIDNTTISTISVVKRIKEKLEIKTDKKLYELLGVKATTFSAWRTRNSLDYKLVLEFCQKNGLDLNYIFFGKNEEPIHKEELYMSELLKAITSRVTTNVSEEISILKETQHKILALLVKEEIHSEIYRARNMPAEKSRKF